MSFPSKSLLYANTASQRSHLCIFFLSWTLLFRVHNIFHLLRLCFSLRFYKIWIKTLLAFLKTWFWEISNISFVFVLLHMRGNCLLRKNQIGVWNYIFWWNKWILFFLLAKFHFRDRILGMEAFVFQWRIPVYLFAYVSGSFPVFSNPRILYPTSVGPEYKG